MNTSLAQLNKKLICVTIGDIEGIGVHLLLKEFKKKKLKDFILIKNINIFIDYIKFPINKINIVSEINFCYSVSHKVKILINLEQLKFSKLILLLKLLVSLIGLVWH